MRQLTTKPFPYYVGIYSLEELVTRESRVCVINMLGSESRKVTPVSHIYSGGNVVAGVQYGRRGELETSRGHIPVYRSVRDAMDQGIHFDTGVIYLPPAAVSQAVWELVRYNKDLKRVVIVTEKVPTRDSRNIRFICQEAGVDVIGANCLGVANVWDHVRVGGALGGDHPEETLKKGSIAIFSNSGNFTTTIAEYLRTAGFGVSTAISSGKDVYIHFALPEFLYAAQNDPRTKAVALYVEPGGYYEKQALEWIKERLFGFNKPVVVCVTGRWKKSLSRSCGHAGAMAGSGDDAESKEKWFDDYFEMPVFDPRNPKVGKKGIRVGSIQSIPEAMIHVFKKIDEKPDFKSTGDLSLKLWIGDTFFKLPESLDLPVVRAISPYDQQIEEINRQLGANFLRQNMRNKSGSSRMNPETFVAELHNKPVLDLAKASFEDNVYFALGKVMPDKNARRLMNLLLNLFLEIDPVQEKMLDMAWSNGCTPNATLASQVTLIGEPDLFRKVRTISHDFIDLVREYQITGGQAQLPKAMEKKLKQDWIVTEPAGTAAPEVLRSEIMKQAGRYSAMQLCAGILNMADMEKTFVRDEYEMCLSAVLVSIFWIQLLEKRISRAMIEDALAYIFTISQIAAYSVIGREKSKYWKELLSRKQANLHVSFTENIFKLLFSRKPDHIEITEFKYLLGLTITNGPGTISAKGAKESVSARNAISMAFAGFLSNTGLAHGGNGFEAVDFLLEQFQKSGIPDPGDREHGVDLEAMARETAKTYARYKQTKKEMGRLDYKRIPCIGHPVFKGNAINIDPREDFVRKELESRNIYNIFLDYYHYLVQQLHYEGATGNIFCVNVDAVLAVITLKLIWKDLHSGRMTKKEARDLVFILFLLGRSIGVAAEIMDHRDRGLDMDCRTPQSEVGYVI